MRCGRLLAARRRAGRRSATPRPSAARRRSPGPPARTRGRSQSLIDARGGQRLGELATAPRRRAPRAASSSSSSASAASSASSAVGCGRARDRLLLQRDELLGLVALDPGLDELRQRRADHLERLGHLRGGARGGRGRVVELVGEPGGHRAQRGEALAVLLDRGDAAHHRRDLLHHAAVDAGWANARRRKSSAGTSATRHGGLGLHARPRAAPRSARRSRPSRSARAGGRPARCARARPSSEACASPSSSSCRPGGCSPCSAITSPGSRCRTRRRPAPTRRAPRRRGRRRGRPPRSSAQRDRRASLTPRPGTRGSARRPSSPRRRRSRRA